MDHGKNSQFVRKDRARSQKQAEHILSELGIPASEAINLFYKQIILQRGLPFALKLPPRPLDIGDMNDAELDAALEKGYDDMKAGRVILAQRVFSDIRENDKT